MIAFHARRLAGLAPLDDQGVDAPSRKVHCEAQADRAASNDRDGRLDDSAQTLRPPKTGD